MSQRERVDVYTIPPNFAKEGTIFSGRIEARNAVEAAILVFLLLQVLLSLDIGVRGKIYVGVIVILPIAIFSVLGVQGERLTSFIFQFFRYLGKRRILTSPDARYRLKRNRRMKKQENRKQRPQKQKGGVKNRKRSKRTEAEAQRSKEIGKAAAERGEAGRESEQEDQ